MTSTQNFIGDVYVGDLPARFLDAIKDGGAEYAPGFRAPFEALEARLLSGSNPRGLFVSGATGVGKTFAVVTFLWRLRTAAAKDGPPSRHRTRFLGDRRFLQGARDAMSAGRLGSYLADLGDRTTLVLDDLASGPGVAYTDFEKGIVADLLDEAYNRMQTLVVTSNHDLTGIAAQLGARTSSRLVEACDVATVKAEDRRLAAAVSA